MKNKILFLCTGNSCRSQMAEGLAKEMGWDAYSAGTKPEKNVNPNAVEVMSELRIDISSNYAKNVEKYLNDSFHIVATVCDNAKEMCPIFSGNTEKNIHYSFNDPAEAIGSKENILPIYRNVRDEIKTWIKQLTKENLV
jgi:arsenate reductase